MAQFRCRSDTHTFFLNVLCPNDVIKQCKDVISMVLFGFRCNEELQLDNTCFLTPRIFRKAVEVRLFRSSGNFNVGFGTHGLQFCQVFNTELVFVCSCCFSDALRGQKRRFGGNSIQFFINEGKRLQYTNYRICYLLCPRPT